MEKSVDKIAKKVVKAWRDWHKTTFAFPTDKLISAMHELDSMFSGKKAKDI